MKNMFKTLFFVLVLVCLSSFAFSCKKEEEPEEPSEPVLPKISAEKTEFKLIVGTKEELKVNVDYETELVLEYTYDDRSIASVVDGKIKAAGVGETNIFVSPRGFEDIYISIHVVVVSKPTVKISGDESMYPGWTTQLTADVECEVEIDKTFTWTSSDDSIARVDENGLVTGLALGVVNITCACGNYTATHRIEVVKEPDQLILDYNGGVTSDLYLAQTAVASVNCTSYNGNFWTKYTSDIFLYTKSSDAKATFSTRIYIGKNENSGFFEVVGTQFSSSSVVPDGTIYVLEMSNSYNDAATVDAQLANVEKGMVVIFKFTEFSKMSQSNPCTVSFYNTDLDNYKVEYGTTLSTLPSPFKLGCEFIGWYDEDDNKVTQVASFTGITVITAKWEEIDPVTSLVIDSIVSEIYTNEEAQITAHVEPSNAYFKDILYTSSNSDILSVDKTGKLVAKNAGTVTITIVDYMKKFPIEKTIVVKMVPSIEVNYETEFDGVLSVGESVKVNPTLIGEASGLDITYTSSDIGVATVENGTITAIANGTAEITLSAGSYSLVIGVTVNGLSEEDKVSKVLKLIANNNFSVVETGNVCLYNDGSERYYTTVYGSVNKYLFDEFKINTNYVSTAVANTAGHKTRRAVDTIQFVTVHDTATLSGDVTDIASTFSGSTNMSIHYTVGTDSIYQVVPEEYIAFHAGDGTSSTFEWLDTGVTANGTDAPTFTVVADGGKYYYAVNGIKTSLEVPTDTPSPSTEKLTNLGPTWTIKDGKYYMGLTWWSQTYQKISSHGGNNNSIGIEMCVNIRGDIYDTWQRTSKLVADILLRNGLDLTRVKQHNTFSGKNCPQCIIAGDYWNNFMEMVALEYELQKNYSDVKISMVSDNPEIVDNTGRVVKSPTVATSVSYTVTVSCGDTTKTIKLYSVIPGNTTWEKWSGTYSASLIWNNGKFGR